MNVMTSMTVSNMDGDLMTRRQVACLFGVTSAAVATWARRGVLAEVRDEAGRPRYRRASVEQLLRTGIQRRPRRPAAVS
jgi:predicted site-specific integrase-resolvase